MGIVHARASWLVAWAAALVTSCGDGTSTGTDGAGAAGPAPAATQAAATTSGAVGGGGDGGSGGEAGAPPAGAPVLVAVGYGGRRASSPDGLTWENDIVVDPNGGDDDNLFRGVGWGGGVFVAVGGSGEGQIATSPDGATWTFRAPASSWVGGAAFERGVFVAAGGNGLRIRSADLGATWTDEQPYFAGHYRGVAAGAGRFVAVGHTYGGNDVGLVSSTTDGVTWSPEQTGGGTFHSVTFGGGLFVAVGQDRCAVSSDGEAWTDAPVFDSGLGRVVFGDGTFALRSDSGLHTSVDGLTWTLVPAASPPQGLLGAGVDVWIGGDWPDALHASADLSSWQLVHGDGGPGFTQVALGWVD